ncbi:tripartite tricarboxylate transporter TctB family protein [Falsirhodobacter xinxiangensis]|uniref:tripartite tricarboxylate transporter TctB family protein n=1 Tax=Falsirhodobacter xinxiangensis TaxID=2530049 RepID=UPI0010AAD36B|nr:tripartite tricarboxylate transporter TctB family protein [Rhodobacter xinxiangensis]
MFKNTELTGGLLLLAFGLWVGIIAVGYPLGSFADMGPGIFPLMVAAAITLCAVPIVVSALKPSGETAEPIPFHTLLVVVGALATFAVFVVFLGLVPAVLALVVVVSYPDQPRNWVHIALIAAGLAALAYAIFILGLNMNIAAFKWGL